MWIIYTHAHVKDYHIAHRLWVTLKSLSSEHVCLKGYLALALWSVWRLDLVISRGMHQLRLQVIYQNCFWVLKCADCLCWRTCWHENAYLRLIKCTSYMEGNEVIVIFVHEGIEVNLNLILQSDQLSFCIQYVS